MESAKTSLQKLKSLLAVLAAQAGLSPQLRRAAGQTIVSRDPERLLTVARAVARELLCRGILLRVAVEGVTEHAGPFALIRGTNRLVDLRPLRWSKVPADDQEVTPGVGVRRSGVPGESGEARSSRSLPSRAPGQPERDRLDRFAGVLGAMEQAQDLAIGDPESGTKRVILRSILTLLGEFLPQFRLFIMLRGEDFPPEEAGSLFVARPQAGEPIWMMHRNVGSSVWIPDWQELPLHIRRTVAAEISQAHPSAMDQPPAFNGAVAVPFKAPIREGDETAGPVAEAGLLFVVARADWGREQLFKLARRLARFVNRRWRHQRLVNQRIHTDSLTGVPNRAFFDGQFVHELERARRSGSPLTLVIADIDHFKRINDRCGHLVGDRVLRRVARWLQDKLRRIDHVCRIGGEEFALILPDTSEVAARDVISRLLRRAVLVERAQGSAQAPLQVKLSFGAVAFPDGGRDAFELYRKADAMLYLSKDGGRNRCHFWSESGDHTVMTPSLHIP